MSRVQMREMVRAEAALIGMIGALLGVLLGLFLGWVFQRVLSTQGIADLVIPWARLVIYVVVGAATGLIAGTIPRVGPGWSTCSTPSPRSSHRSRIAGHGEMGPRPRRRGCTLALHRLGFDELLEPVSPALTADA